MNIYKEKQEMISVLNAMALSSDAEGKKNQAKILRKAAELLSL